MWPITLGYPIASQADLDRVADKRGENKAMALDGRAIAF